jgi:hypothetical protein
MRPYHALRAELYGDGVTHAQLARRLRIGTTTLSRKLNAKSPWTLDECYQVLDLLGKPVDQLSEVFPRGGRNEEDSRCRR